MQTGSSRFSESFSALCSGSKCLGLKPATLGRDPGGPAVAASFATQLDLGEREAIWLADQRHAAWLLIDEAAGRNEATRLGIPTIGTLGILLEAHRRGLADLPRSIDALRSNGFFVSETVIQALLSQVLPLT